MRLLTRQFPSGWRDHRKVLVPVLPLLLRGISMTSYWNLCSILLHPVTGRRMKAAHRSPTVPSSRSYLLSRMHFHLRHSKQNKVENNNHSTQVRICTHARSRLLLYFLPMVIPLLALLMRPVMRTPLRIPAPKSRADRVSSSLCKWMYSSSPERKKKCNLSQVAA